MQFFQDLGSLIEQRWRDQNYCEEGFPEVAQQALIDMPPYNRVNPWDIIRWVNTADHIPEQQDVAGAFGNPPITLFSGPRFHIDVYYWLDGTTAIHQHAFCGAFQVIKGSSIHSQYGFEGEQKLNAHFSVGRVTLREVNLLEEGSTRQIQPGRQYIHSLFHLDRPSITVIARTRQSPASLPQYNYFKPYFAINPFYQSPLLIKKVQSIALLLSMNHPEADGLICQALACSDFHTAFSILNLAFNHLMSDQLDRAFGLSTGQHRFHSYLEVVRHRHKELADLVLPAFEETQRQNHLIYRRSHITSNEHRFFLALLLNVPDRAKVLDLVKERFPEQNPVEAVMGWVEELVNTRVFGSSESNVLGIDNFDDYYLFVFQCMLEGRALERIKDEVKEEFSESSTEDLEEKTEAIYNTIRNSMTFRGIFLNSSKEPVNSYDIPAAATSASNSRALNNN